MLELVNRVIHYNPDQICEEVHVWFQLYIIARLLHILGYFKPDDERCEHWIVPYKQMEKTE
jgi:hypothetical protein